MKQNIYIFSDTIIKRKQNTLFIETIAGEEENAYACAQEEYFFDEELLIPSGDKKYMPVENVESIITFGSTHFNSRLIYFLSQNRIPLHVMNYNGELAGSFIPANRITSAPILIAQVNGYNSNSSRLKIASEIIKASARNTLANLNYYKNRGRNMDEPVSFIEELSGMITEAETIEELLGIEGYIKRNYYDTWKKIFVYPTGFGKRIKKPSPDFINAMISYGNAVLYSIITNIIYRSKLYPEIGFVHSAGENKLSLAYDIADIYKPLIVDRTIFKIVNKNMLSEKDFFLKNGRCMFKKNAKKIFISEFNARMEKKIRTDYFEKRGTYKSIIKHDLYNLCGFLTGGKTLKFYVSKW